MKVVFFHRATGGHRNSRSLYRNAIEPIGYKSSERRLLRGVKRDRVPETGRHAWVEVGPGGELKRRLIEGVPTTGIERGGRGQGQWSGVEGGAVPVIYYVVRAYPSKQPTVSRFPGRKHEGHVPHERFPKGRLFINILCNQRLQGGAMCFHFSLSGALDPGVVLASARHHVLCIAQGTIRNFVTSRMFGCFLALPKVLELCVCTIKPRRLQGG